MNVQYITDENGNQKAVIIPIEEWNKFKIEHDKVKTKLYLLSGIKDSLKEVKEIKEGKRKKGKTLSEVLNEI